jgi:exodeoxyribonuclease-5
MSQDVFSNQEDSPAFTLSDDQFRALFEIKLWLQTNNQPFWRLSGGAGCGKTVLTSYILNNFTEVTRSLKQVAVCTLAWQAALVLRRKGIHSASSIHSLFYSLDRDHFERTGEMRFNQRPIEEIRTTYGLIVVDEAGQTDQDMRDDILAYGVPVLFVGDAGQLPPVAKEGRKLTEEDLNFMARAESVLTEVHRQALDSPIIQLAYMAREGKFIKYGKYGPGVMKISQEEVSDTLLERSTMVVCGKNKTRQSLNARIRETLGIPKNTMPVKGERLRMFNTYKERSLFNGETLTVVSTEQEGYPLRDSAQHFVTAVKDDNNFPFTLKLNFQDRTILPYEGNVRAQYHYKKEQGIIDVDFARVVTCHKAQGGQSPKVLVYEERFGDRDFHRRWLYTAITRAEEKLVIAS